MRTKRRGGPTNPPDRCAACGKRASFTTADAARAAGWLFYFFTAWACQPECFDALAFREDMR